MDEEKRKVYHYLHNSAAGVAQARRLNASLPKDLAVELPQMAGGTSVYVVQVDPREIRTLVVFDGHIPWGGLPKSGDVIRQDFVGRLHRLVSNIRQPRSTEEGPLWHVFDDGKNEATLTIHRHFLLLPKSVSCVRRYDNRSLRPIYTFIEVNEKAVTWRTSSY